MSLEQRVQSLEQEVQLLKAQIQATLLELQEQLLNNKYPLLHADEPTKAAAPMASMSEAPAAPPAGGAYVIGANVADAHALGAQMSARGVKRVALTEQDPEEVVNVRQMGAPTMTSREPEEEVRVQPVVRAKPNGHRPMPDDEAPRRPPSETARFSRSDWDEADDYAQPRPTRSPRISEPPQPNHDDWDEPDYAQPRPTRSPRISEPPKPARPEPMMQAPMSDSEDADARDWIELENWVSQKVEKLGINRTRELINLYTRQERFSRQERELLLQFVTIYDGAPKKSSAQLPAANPNPVRPTIVPQTRAVVDEIRAELRQKRAAAKNKNESYRLSEQQELVMRLIAGILSAGDDDSPSPNSF